VCRSSTASVLPPMSRLFARIVIKVGVAGAGLLTFLTPSFSPHECFASSPSKPKLPPHWNLSFLCSSVQVGYQGLP